MADKRFLDFQLPHHHKLGAANTAHVARLARESDVYSEFLAYLDDEFNGVAEDDVVAHEGMLDTEWYTVVTFKLDAVEWNGYADLTVVLNDGEPVEASAWFEVVVDGIHRRTITVDRRDGEFERAEQTYEMPSFDELADTSPKPFIKYG